MTKPQPDAAPVPFTRRWWAIDLFPEDRCRSAPRDENVGQQCSRFSLTLDALHPLSQAIPLFAQDNLDPRREDRSAISPIRIGH